MNFTDQVWAGAVLDCFARALRWVQGNIFILGALWGLMIVVLGSILALLRPGVFSCEVPRDRGLYIVPEGFFCILELV